MTDPTLRTTQLHQWVDRLRAGDAAAADELVRGVCARLERLARKMLGRFPRVRRWAETDDVLQNAVLRLLRALQQVRPESTRAFFGLAAEQVRRELLDLAKHFYGPEGAGAHHASRGPADSTLAGPADPPAPAEDAEDLERWRAFHEGVERLPAGEREVVGLIFYHGWTRAQVAELLGVDERTIRRRWRAALLKLHGLLGEGPGPAGEAP